jgi:hypothetical protein
VNCLRGVRLALVVLLVALGSVALLARFAAYPFLARQAPVDADVLVVEGWVNDRLLSQAVGWAQSNGVKKIVATGGPIETGSWLAEWGSWAELAVARIDKLEAAQGLERVAAPAADVRRGRTRESARALRASGVVTGRPFNLASEGPHTRRSWRAFRAEFAGECEVGSVALTPAAYDGGDWWRCSEGVRSMVGEWVAYAYDLVLGDSSRDSP